MASLTDQQLLDLFRNALGAIAQNQSYTINGRTYTRANLKDVWDMVLVLEQRVAQSAGDNTGTGIALVRFGSST
jgi:hypothetical protein